MSSSLLKDTVPVKSQSDSIVRAGSSAEAPNNRRLERLLPFFIFIVSLLYLSLFRRFSVMDLDEGIILQAAERILHGQVPYRDFFMFYTPGSAYLVAALFKAFGDSFAVARTSIAVTGAVCTAITYVLARHVCSRNIALLAAALAMLNSFAYRFLVLHNWYATLFASLAIYAALRLWESQKSFWAFACGSLAAITTLIEQSKGAGLCLGLVVGYLILRFSGRQRTPWNSRLATILTAGFFWPWLVTFIYFGLKHGVAAMVEDWLWPLHHYAKVNSVFYGNQNWSEATRQALFHSGPLWSKIFKTLAISPGIVVTILPLIAVGWLVYESVWQSRKDASSSNHGYYVIVSAALSGLLISVLAARADITHLMYLANLWYVVLAWILQDRDSRSRLSKMHSYLIAYVYIAFGLMGFALLLRVNGAQNHIQTRRGVVSFPAEDSAIPYLQAHVAPEGELLVYPYLPIYNYLTATDSPAHVDFFQPGMNTPEQAREIIDSLRSHPSAAILFDPDFSDLLASTWPKTALADIVNDPVGDFIVRNYRVCQGLVTSSTRRVQFMVRKGRSCE
ncbi:MAG TPA: glycosyltransferase family 39 protein [Terriglobales bacterium]|jgi:4-amino-4-deoxy-L-arabinose transferase-like glycosyltransferase|nr:glycosyltransferase family 39 protein [Terriglobales bacterium]